MSMPMRIYTQQTLAPVIVLFAPAAHRLQTDDTTHSSLRRTLAVFPKRIAHIIHQELDRFCIVERRTMAVTSTPYESEAHIIARAKAGDADAIGQLYERYAPQVHRYIASRLGDPVLAEDVCSDVFVKMLEGLDRYEDRGWPFSAWLYRIAYARTMDMLRQARRRPSVPLDESAPQALEPPDEAVISRIAYHELQSVMRILTRDQRLVLRLRFDEDRSLAEIAESLGRTVGSVKALQHRGLARLAEALADHPAHQPIIAS
jgi:RNA polymerase sigma-70 factor (ECF subfamily)